MHTTRQSNKHVDDDVAQASVDDLDDGEALAESGEDYNASREANRGERQLKARLLVEKMLEEKRTRRLAGDDWWDDLDQE